MLSIFKSKAERHKAQLRKIYFKKAEYAIKTGNNNSVKDTLTFFHAFFVESDIYKKYENYSRNENWSIYEVLRDEDFVLLAMYTEGLSRVEAVMTVRMFKSMTGI